MSEQPPVSADVVIIGGGVIGLSAAYHLAAAGVADVVVLERGDLGGGSTSKAAGGVRTAFSDEVNIDLAQRSLAAFERFGDEHDQDIDLHRSGYLFLLRDDAQLADFAVASRLQRRFGIDSQMIGAVEACRLSPLVNPVEVAGAMWSPDDGHCSPESVVLGYARSARRLGVRIVTGCEVTGVDVESGRIAGVQTAHGAISTRTVVCSAGAWSRQVGRWAGVDLPVDALRRHVATTSPVAGLDPHTPFTVDFASSLYFHREGPGLLMGAPDADDVWGVDAARDPSWLEHLAAVMQHRLVGLDEVGLRIGWAGLYEVTPDHNALIGQAEEVEGFVYATGFSGHGFLMGPGVGEVVRDLVTERPPVVDVTTLAATRFTAREARPERHIV
ncbi:MAG: FAD-binding oxidoreductase [Aeromicrobium sp.]|uniref:NAD(P)/FAD-dependent oxidoreductase n=1 Tax=Aeromicrobium sp. TaxID=1871063 RepID=UPI003C4F6C10